MDLRKITGDQNVADILTKVINIGKLKLCMTLDDGLLDH